LPPGRPALPIAKSGIHRVDAAVNGKIRRRAYWPDASLRPQNSQNNDRIKETPKCLAHILSPPIL
jgi:hypothetical protein